MPTPRAPLPIDEALPAVFAALLSHRGAVVIAPPGAGKTTRLPAALLETSAPMALAGEIVVLEPRRLAARLAAEHTSAMLGEQIGGRVGYSVRFDERRSARTVLRFVTSGVLLRSLETNPTLSGVSLVIFDEIHERHAIDDVLLAWVRRLRATTRPDLGVIAMSATFAPGPVARYLDVPLITSEGRAYPVEIVHASRTDSRAIGLQVAAAVEAETDRPDSGDLLVFLPGVRAIERCQGALRSLAEARRLEVLPLHAGLPPDVVNDALRPRNGGIRRVLLATNVAESSVTLDGVRTVIDSGLHNVARWNPWTGLSALIEEPVPKSSADQRAGRAGRQAPGRAVRLYDRGDYDRRPTALDPELRRADLTDLVLSLAGLGVTAVDALDWLDAPDLSAFKSCRDVLELLGAVDSEGTLTATGRRLLRLPVHPRLGTLVFAAAARGALDLGAMAAAVLAEDVRLPDGLPDSDSDVFALVRAAKHGGDLPRSVRQRIDATARDLTRAARGLVTAQTPRPDGDEEARRAVREAILHAFPDRVARRRDGDPRRVMLVDGGSAELSPNSTVRHEPWLTAVDATGGGRSVIRLASAIEPDWLIDLPGAERDLTETVDVRWNDRSERVEAFESTRYRGLPIDRRSIDPRGRPEASRRLRDEVRAAGLARFTDADALEKHLLRRAIAAAADNTVTSFDAVAVEALLDEICSGAVSFKEVREADLLSQVVHSLTSAARSRLDTLAPERVGLPSGRSAPIKYVAGAAPRISAQVQHLFGLTDTPRIGGGKVKLLVELLAPNQRPVQLTDDLAGFWSRTWTEVRKELRGRYPKHKWPEDPRIAVESRTDR